MKKRSRIVPQSRENRMVRGMVVVMVGWMMGMGVVQAQDPLLAATVRLYGEPVISANPDLLNSTSNDAGPWGAKEFLYSFNNDLGPLGSPEFLGSVSNEVGTGQRIRFSEDMLKQIPGLKAAVELYGDPVVSANPYLLNSTSNDAGPWGAKEFLYSFNNDVGPLGSPEFLNSVSNEYGTGLKVELVEPALDLVAP